MNNFMKYFNIEFEDELSIVGAYPQVVDLVPAYDRSRASSFSHLKFDAKPTLKPDLNGFVLDEKAILTDVLSCWILYVSEGIFLSQKASRLFQEYEISHCFFFESMLHKGADLFEYSFLFIMHGLDLLDYRESTIHANDLSHPSKKPEEVEIKSSSDFLEKYKMYYKSEQKLTISEAVLRKPLDLFRLPFSANLTVSERLVKKVLSENINGIKFVPSSIKINHYKGQHS